VNEVRPGNPADPARPGDAPRQSDTQPGETLYLGDAVEHLEQGRAGATPPPAEPGYPDRRPAFSGGPRGGGAEYSGEGAGYSGETLYLRDTVGQGDPGRAGGVPGPATDPGYPAVGSGYADDPRYPGGAPRPGAEPGYGDAPRGGGAEYSGEGAGYSGETLYLRDTVAQGDPGRAGDVPGPATDPGYPAVSPAYGDDSPYPGGTSRPAPDPAYGDAPRGGGPGGPGYSSGETLYLGGTAGQGDPGRAGGAPGPATDPGYPAVGPGYAEGSPYPVTMPPATGDSERPDDGRYTGDPYSGGTYAGGGFGGETYSGDTYPGDSYSGEAYSGSGNTYPGSGDAYQGDPYSGGEYIGQPVYTGPEPRAEEPGPSAETGQNTAPVTPFTIVDRPEMLVVGYAVRTSPAIEADPSRAQLPALWRRAGAPGAFAHVPARVDENLYAVLTDYESDHRGAYTQVVGIAVHTAARLPEGMVAVRVPGVPVMKLEARGPMPQALIEAWQQVWKHTETGASPARAFTTDVEVHHPDGADLYIAVLMPPS